MNLDGAFSVTRREDYIEVVERFFWELDQKQSLEAVAAFFHPDAVFTIIPDTQAQGRAAIADLFKASFDDKATRLVHTNFVHCVDVQHHRCACQFEVAFERSDGRVDRFSNCNFFYFAEGLFRQVFVYVNRRTEPAN